MRLIAHRGLTNGPDSNLENKPEQIEQSLKQGFDCEIDVWYKNGWFLGHDMPQYGISIDFLKQPGLWIHAKNLEALYQLGAYRVLNYFWHQTDDFTLTSRGYIWTYPGKDLTTDSILVLPEMFDPELKNEYILPFGICSDYVEKLKRKYDSK